MARMSRRIILKVGVAGAALSVSAPYVSSRAAPLTMRFAHFGAEDHPSNVAATQFADRVASRTDGEIKINIFPNNVLGGPPEQAQHPGWRAVAQPGSPLPAGPFTWIGERSAPELSLIRRARRIDPVYINSNAIVVKVH